MTELYVVTVCGEVETITQVFSDLVKSNQYYKEMSKIYNVNDYRIIWAPVVIDCEVTTQILSHVHLEKLKDSEWTSLYNSKINN
jgi:hypothetical protein